MFNIIAYILIWSISIVYFVVAFPRIIKSYVYLPIISIFAFIFTNICLFVCQHTDPGIIPRKHIFKSITPDGIIPFPYA